MDLKQPDKSDFGTTELLSDDNDASNIRYSLSFDKRFPFADFVDDDVQPIV